LTRHLNLVVAYIALFLFQLLHILSADPPQRPEHDYRIHEIGRIRTTVTNFGIHGGVRVTQAFLQLFPEPVPSLEWPAGSGIQYVQYGGLMICAIGEEEKRCSICDYAYYGEYDFQPTEGTTLELPAYPAKSAEDSYVTFDDFEDSVNTSEPLGLLVNQRGLTWNGPEYDDFLIFEYEIIKEMGGENYSGDELTDVYVGWVYDGNVGFGKDTSSPWIDDLVDFDGWNGNNPEEFITYREDMVENGDWNGSGKLDGYDDMGIPHGWEYVGNASIPQVNYDPLLAYPDGFYDSYTVLIPSDPLTAPVIRWQTDAANPDYTAYAGEIAVVDSDTLRGYVVPRNMSYIYDADDPRSPEDDTGENGDVPGFVGLRLIYSDVWKRHGPYEETGDDTLLRPYNHQWFGFNYAPASDQEIYDYIAGDHNHALGSPFMPNPLVTALGPFDHRFLLGTGPIAEFALNDTLYFVIAEVVGKGIGGLRQNADNALYAYFAGSAGTPYDPSGPEEDVHYRIPVPPPTPELAYSAAENEVTLIWDSAAETHDFEGYRLYRSKYKLDQWELIAAWDNVDGPVAVVDIVSGDTLFDGQLFDLPPYDGEPQTHLYLDIGGTFYARDVQGNDIALIPDIEAPVNNVPYYYVLTAYDNPAEFGSPDIPVGESPRTNYKKNFLTGEPMPIFPGKTYSSGEEWDGREVSIFPNPYRGGSHLEKTYEGRVSFTNLPPACKITIFTLTGDIIKEIYHNDGTAYDNWNLTSKGGASVVSGLYIYVVEADLPTWPEIQRGTFVVLKGN